MKITKKILENLIKQELEALISEQDGSRGSGNPFGTIDGREFGKDYVSYKTKADADAALAAATAGDGKGTYDAKLGDHHQMIAKLQQKVADLEEVVRNIEMNLGVQK